MALSLDQNWSYKGYLRKRYKQETTFSNKKKKKRIGRESEKPRHNTGALRSQHTRQPVKEESLRTGPQNLKHESTCLHGSKWGTGTEQILILFLFFLSLQQSHLPFWALPFPPSYMLLPHPPLVSPRWLIRALLHPSLSRQKPHAPHPKARLSMGLFWYQSHMLSTRQSASAVGSQPEIVRNQHLGEVEPAGTYSRKESKAIFAFQQ